jgi:hypothetical protein
MFIGGGIGDRGRRVGRKSGCRDREHQEIKSA